MVRATKGVLVQCDPSIKAMICKIDEEANEKFIIEELDDETLVVKEAKIADLKIQLSKALADTQMEVVDSNSE